MITDTVQRWTERRESRRPAGELIRRADYEVARIESAAEARAFVERHHYAGTASSTAHRFYQAMNMRHLGRTKPSTLRLFPDGTVFSSRAASKIAQGDVGRRYAAAQLVRWGADPLRDGEDALAWLRLWRARLTRPMRHRGCLRYVLCLDRRRRREVLTAPAFAYPKLDGAA